MLKNFFYWLYKYSKKRENYKYLEFIYFMQKKSNRYFNEYLISIRIELLRNNTHNDAAFIKFQFRSRLQRFKLQSYFCGNMPDRLIAPSSIFDVDIITRRRRVILEALERTWISSCMDNLFFNLMTNLKRPI